MKITGIVEDISLNTIRFDNLKGVESRCSETLKPFKKGDKILTVALGEVISEDSIELSDGIYFVTIDGAKDFLLRFLDNLKPSEQTDPEIDKTNLNS